MNQAGRLAGASWIKRLVPVGLALCGGLASEQMAMQALLHASGTSSVAG